LIVSVKDNHNNLIVGPPGTNKSYSVRVTLNNKTLGTVVSKASSWSAAANDFTDNAKTGNCYFVSPNVYFHHTGILTLRVEVLDGARSLLNRSFEIEVCDAMQYLHDIVH
jgi:hypothetical protein